MKHFIIFYTFESSEKTGSGYIGINAPIFPNHVGLLKEIGRVLAELYRLPTSWFTIGITSILPVTKEELAEYGK